MIQPVACARPAWRSFARLSGLQLSALIWVWSWNPLRFSRRHPPHRLSPARLNHRPAGQDPEAGCSRPSRHSNALFGLECQSILSKIVAAWVSQNGPGSTIRWSASHSGIRPGPSKDARMGRKSGLFARSTSSLDSQIDNRRAPIGESLRPHPRIFPFCRDCRRGPGSIRTAASTVRKLRAISL
jgi:hypothetical protein